MTVSSEAKNLRFTGGLLGSELLASGDFALDLVARVTSATDRSALELPSYRTAVFWQDRLFASYRNCRNISVQASTDDHR